MESAKTKIRINHVTETEVKRIAQTDGGWWVHFDGSRESIFFNGEKPYEVGDRVKITFEKVST